MTDTVQNNRALVERFLTLTHSPDIEDIELIDDLVAPDAVCHGFPGMNPTDRDSYKAWFRFFRGAFGNMEFEVPRIVADETHVAAQWIVRVDHTGPFAGVAPTGRRVEFDGVAIYRIEGGRIVETWLHPNEAALLAQIGVLQAAA